MTEQYSQPELPFEGGLPPNEFDLKALVGCTILVAVGGCHPDMSTRYGIKPAVRAAVVVLNGPDAGKEHIDVLIFNSRVVRVLRSLAGKARVAHVDIDNTTTNPAVVLQDTSADEFELARKWYMEHPERTDDLVQVMVATFNANVAQLGQQQQQRPAQPQRSMPPPAPPGQYGRTPPPSSPPSLGSFDDTAPF